MDEFKQDSQEPMPRLRRQGLGGGMSDWPIHNYHTVRGRRTGEVLHCWNETTPSGCDVIVVADHPPKSMAERLAAKQDAVNAYANDRTATRIDLWSDEQ